MNEKRCEPELKLRETKFRDACKKQVSAKQNQICKPKRIEEDMFHPLKARSPASRTFT